MVISLGYIEGISRIDTPAFSSISAQSDYFDSHEVVTIDTTFYPPHYLNEITVEDTDMDFNTSVNYLWFEFNEKRYYYFIDSVEYVSESLIKLSISMDVIQTYYYNVRIRQGIVERLHIKRWNGNNISRDYIRENVSEGDFIPGTKDYEEDSEYWLVLKITELMLQNSGVDYKVPFISNVKDARTNYGYIFIPLFTVPTLYRIINESPEEITEEWVSLLREPNIVDAYVIDYNPLPYYMGIYVNPVTQEVRLNYNKAVPSGASATSWETILRDKIKYYLSRGAVLLLDMEWQYNPDHTFIQKPRYCRFDYNVDVQRRTIHPITFSKNNSIHNNASLMYEPVLFDDNYYRIEFGNINTKSIIPLYYGINTDISILHYCSIDSGAYVYYMSYDTTGYIDNKFNNLVTDTDILQFDLFNDPWVQYQANNKNRWVTSSLKDGISTLSIFIKMGTLGLTASYINNDINSILSNPDAFDKRYKHSLKFKSTGEKELTRLTRQKSSLPFDAATAFVGNLPGMNSVQQHYTDANYKAMPISPSQLSTFELSNYIKGKLRYYQVYTVKDIQQVFHYYQRNGYKVNQYVYNIPNVFDSANIRYYFNILKFGDVDVHLENVIEDEETISLITDRLIAGIRLWNINHGDIGNYQYDNIENQYV